MFILKNINYSSIPMSIKRYLSCCNDFTKQMFDWCQSSPIFPINGQQIEVIKRPKDFYQCLKDLALNSKQRITLSSLYVGTGALDKQFISCLEKVKQTESDLELTILLDYNRSTRVNRDSDGESSTKSVLTPLTHIGANVAFYLSPEMSGWRKYCVLNRQQWNELVSLHHIKCYIFDDNLVISGANLSDLYYTNRQDRYVLFRNCQHLCDYFDQLIKTISTFSMQLNPNGQFCLHQSWNFDPLNYFERNKFINEAKSRIDRLNDRFRNKFSSIDSNTIVFPLLQFKTVNICDDQYFTSKLLQNYSESCELSLSSGYFNLTEEYKHIIVGRKSIKPFRLLMSSEKANGFYGGKGLTAYIPSVYTYLTQMFMKDINPKQSNILVYLYDRPKWTFHAKGLWLSIDSQLYLTMIGSPNFGYRSVYRDTEAQLVLLTTDTALKNRLESECNDLFKYSDCITQNDLPKVPFWVSLVAKFMKSYF